MIDSEYERSGTTVQPYTRSDGTFVRGHERQGGWVHSPWYRKKVSETIENLRAPGSPLLFASKCKCCRKDIFVYRSKENGCVVYDSLQKPWNIHRCWDYYSFFVLTGVAESLLSFGYNGSDYRRDIRALKKINNTKMQSVTGFVFRQSRIFRFPSIKDGYTTDFRYLFFIPSEKPDRYIEVFIPINYDDEFEEQTAHTLTISYAKYRGVWRCFAEQSTRIIPGSYAPEEKKSILKLNDRCAWCRDQGIFKGKWGFDTENRVECEDCGCHRLGMTNDRFRKQIKNWYNSMRRS